MDFQNRVPAEELRPLRTTDPLVNIDWQRALAQLDESGFALLSDVLTKKICEAIAAGYTDDGQFRSRIDMARYAFGRGEYKYFKYPLPKIVQQLRSSMYPHLVPLANEWLDRLGSSNRATRKFYRTSRGNVTAPDKNGRHL